jgi:hypothetical protein
MKLSAKLIYLFVVFSLYPMFAHAVIRPVDGGGGVPLDGGISLLVAAGVGYGAKKMAAKKKAAEEAEQAK